ncbi:MAG: ATPase, T2SS/T4P/T4SS family [Alkalispirochaeta sp.]
MNQVLSSPLYRSEFSRATGVAFLRETDYEVHLVHWREVPPKLRRTLHSVHGKQLVFHRVGEHDAVTLVATGRERPTAVMPSEIGGSVAGTSRNDAIERDRLRNLSPEDALLRRILAAAVDADASDISFWPATRMSWMVTIRVQGTIHPLTQVPAAVADRVVQRIMTLAGMDLLDRTSPQNAMLRVPWFPHQRFRAAVVGTATDRRESERVVAIRILARAVPYPPALGYTPAAMRTILHTLHRGSGLVLFAGPTGSGKTTGIASFLSVVSDTGRKIITLEDPVEYRLPRIVQIERDGSIGPELIAAAMRQDPDLIVLGETRSADHGAQLAQALLTGHQVVSSVHAGDLPTVRARMVQLGVPSDLLAVHTDLVVCQQLRAQERRLDVRLHPDPWRGTTHG